MESELNNINKSNIITVVKNSIEPDSLIQKALKNRQNDSDKTLEDITEDQLKFCQHFLRMILQC